MEARNISATDLTQEQVEPFLESLNGKMGAFDMYYTFGPADCFCVKGAIAVVIGESNWSDCGGGIERNNSIKIFDEELKIIAESAQVNYRHMSDGKYDNYNNHYSEILNIETSENGFDVKVKTGKGNERVIFVSRKSPNKAE